MAAAKGAKPNASDGLLAPPRVLLPESDEALKVLDRSKFARTLSLMAFRIQPQQVASSVASQKN